METRLEFKAPPTEKVSTQTLLDVGRLHYEKADFKRAVPLLEEASLHFFESKNFDSYLKSLNLLLRMYAEQDDLVKITAAKEKLQQLVTRDNYPLSSKTFYTLGVCAALRDQDELALEHFQKALTLGLNQDSKEDICYAINGIAIVYYKIGKLEEALNEVYNLKVFFQLLPLPDLQLSCQILNAHILRKIGKYPEALSMLWKCYEILKHHKNIHFYLSLLYGLGLTLDEAGDSDLAKVYLHLARNLIDEDSLKVLYRQVVQRLERIGPTTPEDYDLVLHLTAKKVTERLRGTVDFRNQFILLDLLNLFLQNPGEVYSKEKLVQKIWKQEYDPVVHDNKIYVTIKRLRKLIEPDFDKPRYIFRAKNGYYLNKNTRIRISE